MNFLAHGGRRDDVAREVALRGETGIDDQGFGGNVPGSDARNVADDGVIVFASECGLAKVVWITPIALQVKGKGRMENVDRGQFDRKAERAGMIPSGRAFSRGPVRVCCRGP